MRRRVDRVGCAFALLMMTAPAAVAGDAAMSVHDAVRAPTAFYQFCAQNAGACRPSGPPIAAIRLTPRRLADLEATTRRVNHSVTETPDYKQYGREDVWAYPTSGKGDCEDYVLEKRRELIAAGWPSSVLLVTVVRDEKGDGHAVLTVPTDRGDLVLDSRNDAIRRWSQTPYTFYTRQSANDPKSFAKIVSLNPSAEGVAAVEMRALAAAAASAGRGKGAASAGSAGGSGRGAAASSSGRDNAGSNGRNNGNGAGNSNAGGNGGGNGNGGGGSAGSGGGNGGGSSGSDSNGGGGNGGGNGGGQGNGGGHGGNNP